MARFDCPNCGAPISFLSSLSVSSVCAHCQTLVVRKDLTVETIGKMAQLPEDMSPFQIGTQARDGTCGIGLVGRSAHEMGRWVLERMDFVGEDGRKGWLAEAQGTYAISYEYDQPVHPNTTAAINRWVTQRNNRSTIVGMQMTLSEDVFVITDSKLAECVGCEGELPFIAQKGRRSLSFDFMGDDERFASVVISDNERHIFVGRYLSWKSLAASNLKPVEGWS